MSGLAQWPASMDAVSLCELIETQAIAWIRADAQLEALIADRVWTSVPPDAPYPFVMLEAFIISPFNRLRGFGRSVTFQLRAQSQVRGDYETHRIADRIAGLLDGKAAPLPPAKRALWSIDEAPGASYTDVNAGILTYHRTVSVRVRVQV
ncbi:MAG TPA: DUF3168 domain-containing protein [Nitrospiraceae bacterium]|nr:DUF3168 domain-containing protein [Nitrospiraceae bacterium]